MILMIEILPYHAPQGKRLMILTLWPSLPLRPPGGFHSQLSLYNNHSILNIFAPFTNLPKSFLFIPIRHISMEAVSVLVLKHEDRQIFATVLPSSMAKAVHISRKMKDIYGSEGKFDANNPYHLTEYMETVAEYREWERQQPRQYLHIPIKGLWRVPVLPIRSIEENYGTHMYSDDLSVQKEYREFVTTARSNKKLERHRILPLQKKQDRDESKKWPLGIALIAACGVPSHFDTFDNSYDLCVAKEKKRIDKASPTKVVTMFGDKSEVHYTVWVSETAIEPRSHEISDYHWRAIEAAENVWRRALPEDQAFE